MTGPLTPPPDGLERALREAQRRRLHSAGFGAPVMALGCAALLALSSTAGSDVLGQDRVPDVGSDGSGVSLVPVPEPRDGERSPRTAVRPVQRPSAPALPSAPAQEPGVDRGPVEPSAPRASTLARSDPGMTREGPLYIVSPRTTCTVGERTLCSGLDVTPIESGFSVVAHLCSHGPAPVSLRFPGSLEVDLVVGPPGAPDWRWSDGRTFDTAPHTLRLEQGQCWRWSTTYDARSSDGGPLPAGMHRMTAEFTAEALGDASQAQADFVVDETR